MIEYTSEMELYIILDILEKIVMNSGNKTLLITKCHCVKQSQFSVSLAMVVFLRLNKYSSTN